MLPCLWIVLLCYHSTSCSAAVFSSPVRTFTTLSTLYTKNLAIADVTGKEYLLCSCNDGINRDLADDNLDLYLRQQGCIDFCTTIHFACTLLDAAAHYLCHGHTGYTKVV